VIDPSAIDVWLIDGFNVLHACLLKGRERERWWSAETQAQVAQWLEDFACKHSVVVVFDAGGEHSERCSKEGFSVTFSFAPDADAEIIRLVQAATGRVCVVTADRSLSDRCRARGARTLKPWPFDELLARPRAASSSPRRAFAGVSGAEIADHADCSDDSG
jgi:predicted RNA-binding protein with PIN domain